jgi:transcription elongation factor Elf1
MVCWYCKRIVVVPGVVKNILTDTIEVNVNVRKLIQKVRCSSCGARYELEIYLDAKPTVSKEMLARLDNRIHP